jgi:Family of unknown function (DUF5687)
MVKWFIIHQWKSTQRSTIRQKSLILNIVIGFFMFLMMLYLLAIGLFINKILQEVYPEGDHVFIFNGYLIYYFVVALFMRFMMQSLPRINIESYLHLPIKKKLIVHYVVNRTTIAIFNFLPLLVFIPVAVNIYGANLGAAEAWTWLIAMILLVFTNSFFSTYLKRQLGSQPKVVGLTGVLIIFVMLMDYFGIFSISTVSSMAFGYLLLHKYLLLVPVLMLIGSYRLHYNFLKKRLYPEEIGKAKSRKIDTISELRYLKSMGITGDLIALDMRLFWRNKRTRTILYFLPLFLLYGLFFYPNPVYKDMSGFLIFVGIFMTGGMMLNYANYAFAYESSYFDALATKNINMKQYVRVKYFVAIAISAICFVLTIPYVFMGTKYLFINSMTFLYNIGVLSVLLLYMATYNKQRMDLSRGQAFNYQGISGMNWLAMLPAFLMPVLIYWPFSYFDMPNTGLMFIGVLGLLGLVFNKFFVGLIVKNFYNRKYKMAEGFRQK